MKRDLFRLALAAVVLLSVGAVVEGAFSRPPTASADETPRPAPRPNPTVVTESAQFGTIIAWHENGSLQYYGDEHTKYYDVDPVGEGEWTVEYAAVDTIHNPGPNCVDPPCTRNVIERLNLSTGEKRVVYARYDGAEWGAEWHDHVRVDDEHVLIADIVHDQVFMVNTTTDLVEWRWDAQSDFDVANGGPYPKDWTHINDVSLLDDGRIMVSLRNLDRVVFLDPETGLKENWTLGNGSHGVLFEQHNPDYVPAERGGPAVLVADSENGRLLEYQRVDGGWKQTWQWRDDRMAWPRDADRLPNGHTLAVDTHGNRILEISRNGSVVWEVPMSHPYDVERLGTGGGSDGSDVSDGGDWSNGSGENGVVEEESTGESARRLGLEDRTPETTYHDRQPIEAFVRPLEGIAPSGLVNAAVYLTPVWVGRTELAAIAVGSLAGITWLAAEAWWRLPGLGLRLPVYRRRK